MHCDGDISVKHQGMSEVVNTKEVLVDAAPFEVNLLLFHKMHAPPDRLGH